MSTFSKYEKLESDLVNLFSVNQVFDIKALPDNESEFHPQLPRPLVIVFYNDSDFADNESNSIVKQDEKLKVYFQMLSKTRRGDKGIFSIFETIRKTLIGYKLPGFDKFSLIQFSPSENSGAGNWSYTALFTTSTKIAECLTDPDEQGNLLKNPQFTRP